MKSLIYIGMIITISQNVFSQSKSVVVGEWKVDLTKTIQEMKNQEKSRYDSISSFGKENMRNVYDNRTFIFSTDNEFTVEINRDRARELKAGTWAYDAISNTLTLLVEGEKDVFDLEFVSKNLLKLNHRNTSTDTLIKSTYLKRLED